MKHCKSTVLSSRFLVIGGVLATLLFPPIVRAETDSIRAAMAFLRTTAGYQSATSAVTAFAGSSYSTPLPEPESGSYGVGELRAVLSHSAEDRYVDLARFDGLREEL